MVVYGVGMVWVGADRTGDGDVADCGGVGRIGGVVGEEVWEGGVGPEQWIGLSAQTRGFLSNLLYYSDSLVRLRASLFSNW